MYGDIVDLRTFYASTLGRLAERSIARALTAVWQPLANERLVGLGYPLPWLDRFAPDTERTFAFMPAGQGAVNWPPEGPGAAVAAGRRWAEATSTPSAGDVRTCPCPAVWSPGATWMPPER